MIEIAKLGHARLYMSWLVALVQAQQHKDQRCFVLIHDRGCDVELARQLGKSLSRPIDVVDVEDPLVLKGLIGQSSCVISSKFYCLVSALSQGIPALATGWNHKQQMLMQDYLCPELLVHDLYSANKASALVDQLYDHDQRHKVVSKIEQAAQQQKQASWNMWSEVRKMVLE